MTRGTLANVLVVGGLVAVACAAWLVHPAAGVAVAGIAAVAVGIGLVREDT
jgi:multisubunit Na+/H+ antiporter MnhB subunit